MYIPTTTLTQQGTPNLVYDQTLAVAAASFDTTGTSLSGFRNLLLCGDFRTETGSNTRAAIMQFNGDTGANYDVSYIQVNNTTVTGTLTQGGASIPTGLVIPSDATANYFGSMQCLIVDYANTTRFKDVQFIATAVHNTAAQVFTRTGGGVWKNTAAITRVVLGEGVVNYAVGSRLMIYGLQ